MKIAVYYDHPEEQALAERLVPDVEAIAKFAADALGEQFKTQPTEISVYASANYGYRGEPGPGSYTLADIQAMRSVGYGNPNVRPPTLMPGGGAGGSAGAGFHPGGAIMSNPLEDQSRWASAASGPGDIVYLGDVMGGAKLYGVLDDTGDPTKATAMIEFEGEQL